MLEKATKVSLVIVSHSAKLGAGVAELARQMGSDAVPIAVAAGIDDPENPLGTDPMKVQAAIESVYSDRGVVILMDLGSAVMSAEMALEFLSDEQKQQVRLCAAPLVEGAIAAAAQAAAGASLEQVMAEAQKALSAKALSLDEEVEPQKITRHSYDLPSQELHLIVHNSLGIHARPAAQLVKTANRFQAQITLQNLTRQSLSVSAKSITQLVTLGIRQGHKIVLSAHGTDAAEAVAALVQLIENLDEAAPPTPDVSPEDSTILKGIPASPGIAIGSAIIFRPTVPEVTDQLTSDPQSEWQQLEQAIQIARREIEELQNLSAGIQAEILASHLLYLDDPTLIEQVQQRIFGQHQSAAAAWQSMLNELVASYHTLDDAYFRERATDVSDVGQRVLRVLLGTTAQIVVSEPGILIAPELMPSEVSQLSPDRILGICTTAGSATAHSALIAKLLGIPTIVSLGKELLEIVPGTQIAIDGSTGQVWLEPSPSQRQQLESKIASPPPISLEPKTQDGKKVPILANIMSAQSAQQAVNAGAEGVGLLRTEFLYLERTTAPTEVEQVESYRAIANILGSRPLTIRTLDVGGDKAVPYLNLPSEANPFLGWRGIRQSLDCPDVFKTQLRAILRTSQTSNIKLLLPMVSSIEEVRAAKTFLADAKAELQEADIPFATKLPLGIMIEVPAAVVLAPKLAAEVDFFSIGTNDLSQYIIAADRANAKVSSLADAFAPPVLWAIQQTVSAAKTVGIPVCVCGELASEPLATPLLIGLGVDELSVNPAAIASVRAAISQITLTEASAIAQAALQLDSAAAVRDYVRKRIWEV